MINLIYQGLAVTLRSILVFLFIYVVSRSPDRFDVSSILAEFTYASIFANIICFGFDLSIIQQKKLVLERKSFVTRISLGMLISMCLIYLQELSLEILFISTSLASALILKGFVRASKRHKLDFIINLLSFLIFLVLLTFTTTHEYSLLTALGVSLIIPNVVALLVVLKFKNNETYQNIFLSVYKNSPLMVFSLLAYLWLNVDVYVFEYLNKIESYNNFVIPNKFFINLTMIPVILSNYRISFVFKSESYYHARLFYEFVFVGLLIAIFAFLFGPLIINIISSNNINLSRFELGLFSLVVFLRSINSYYNMRILKHVNNWTRLCVMFLSLLIHLFLLHKLINLFDWKGAVYALTLSTICFTGFNRFILKKHDGR